MSVDADVVWRDGSWLMRGVESYALSTTITTQASYAPAHVVANELHAAPHTSCTDPTVALATAPQLGR